MVTKQAPCQVLSGSFLAFEDTTTSANLLATPPPPHPMLRAQTRVSRTGNYCLPVFHRHLGAGSGPLEARSLIGVPTRPLGYK